MYAANDPLNKIDPLGLSWRNPCIGSACLLDTPGALVDTLSNVPAPSQAYRHLKDEGGASVDRYITQFGEVPTGLDLVNVAINPGYKTIDRCSAYACGSGAALDCALATADLVGTAFAIEQAGAGAVRITASALRPSSLLDDLAASGVKHTPSEVVSVARDGSGRIVFLEQGNAEAGLQHILRHSGEFAQFGVTEAQIGDLVVKAATQGTKVGMQGLRPIFEVTFDGQLRRVAVTVGSNGFIVGANIVG